MSIFKNNKQTKLTTTLIQDLNWMVKRVSVDTLPEYQQNSDTLRFRDNIKLYEFEIEWIRTGFSHHLRELEIQELQKRCLESVSYNSNNFKYPTPL
jgi:hypothetical protein